MERRRTDTLRRVSASVAVDGTDPVRLRAVSALLADHRIDRVGILGASPPKSWGERVERIADTDGFDLVVGTEEATVSVAGGGAVSWAGPTGLTRALGVRLGESELAATRPGEPNRDGRRFGFPAPIGWLRGMATDGIHHCPHRSTLTGVMAVTSTGHSLAIVDDRSFLDGCALAAGVLLAVGGHVGPVWESADRYLDTVVELGLVIADRH